MRQRGTRTPSRPGRRSGSTYRTEETSMNLKKTAMLVVMGMSALAAPIAFGADGDGMQSF